MNQRIHRLRWSRVGWGVLALLLMMGVHVAQAGVVATANTTALARGMPGTAPTIRATLLTSTPP